jgi:IMP cyclohydrolase
VAELRDALRTNAYPGRVVLFARTIDGELAGGYALTGRSPESRARRIEVASPRELTVAPVGTGSFDMLRHYACARGGSDWTVFGNGDHVSDVYDRLAEQPPPIALDDVTYEPDPPIHTARLTAVVHRASGRAWLGAARRSAGRRSSPDVSVIALRDLAPGDVVLLSTYQSDGETVATARTHHDLTTSAHTGDDLLTELWAALDPRFQVAATTFRPLAGVVGPIRHAAGTLPR